jgi:hypothetical protein
LAAARFVRQPEVLFLSGFSFHKNRSEVVRLGKAVDGGLVHWLLDLVEVGKDAGSCFYGQFGKDFVWVEHTRRVERVGVCGKSERRKSVAAPRLSERMRR